MSAKQNVGFLKEESKEKIKKWIADEYASSGFTDIDADSKVLSIENTLSKIMSKEMFEKRIDTDDNDISIMLYKNGGVDILLSNRKGDNILEAFYSYKGAYEMGAKKEEVNLTGRHILKSPEKIIDAIPQLKRLHETKGGLNFFTITFASEPREEEENFYIEAYPLETSHLNLFGDTVWSEYGRALSIKLSEEEAKKIHPELDKLKTLIRYTGNNLRYQILDEEKKFKVENIVSIGWLNTLDSNNRPNVTLTPIFKGEQHPYHEVVISLREFESIRGSEEKLKEYAISSLLEEVAKKREIAVERLKIGEQNFKKDKLEEAKNEAKEFSEKNSNTNSVEDKIALFKEVFGKEIISINGFCGKRNSQRFSQLWDEDVYNSAVESGSFAQNSYIERINFEATDFYPTFLEKESHINHFDYVNKAGNSITAYWKDNNGETPAYMLKLDGNTLEAEDRPIDMEHPNDRGLVYFALDEVLSSHEKALLNKIGTIEKSLREPRVGKVEEDIEQCGEPQSHETQKHKIVEEDIAPSMNL